MATITTFSTLKTAVADWLDRDDISAVGGPIDVMIALMEEELYRDLRLRFMETALNVTLASGVAAIPSDFLELKFAYIDGSPTQPLQMKPSEWIYQNYPLRSQDSRPQFMSTEGDNFIFGPFPDGSTYTLKGSYYARPTDLSTSNETNWLTTNAPGLLLNGTLLQSIGYLGMDERVSYWRQEFDRLFTRVMQADKRERFPSEMQLTVIAS